MFMRVGLVTFAPAQVRPLSDDHDESGRATPPTHGDPGVNLSVGEPARATPPRDVPLDEARLRQQAIGVKLRQMFDEVVSEPVPDDFLAILRRADERRAGK